jgi:hypothetical protein
MSKKDILIKDIQKLLNSYQNLSSTTIDPSLLEFMDEETLITIIDYLLKQKENVTVDNVEWLNKFKSNQL